MKILKELYGLIYGEFPQASLAQEALHREIEHIKDPIRDREDFEQLQDICLEVSSCSQEYGWIMGFKAGVAFMMECLEE